MHKQANVAARVGQYDSARADQYGKKIARPNGPRIQVMCFYI